MSFNPEWYVKDEGGQYSAEAYVLSALVNGRSEEISFELLPEYFRTPEARFYFGMISDLKSRGINVTQDILTEEISERVKGNPGPILAGLIPLFEDSSQQTSYWTKKLIESHVDYIYENGLRKILEGTSRAEQRSKLSKLLDEIRDLESHVDETGHKSCANTILTTIARMEQEIVQKKSPLVVKTGFLKLDQKLRMLPGFLIVLGARAGLGKTSFAVNVALGALKEGKSVLFISQETSEDIIHRDLLALVSGVDRDSIATPVQNKNFEQLERVSSAGYLLANYKLTIDDRPRASPNRVEQKIKEAKRKWGKVDIVIIDHLHIMKADGRVKDMRETVTECTSGLKEIASRQKVAIFALAQLNRDAAETAPKLHHLKESGSIEQDADYVLLMHRENYQNPGHPDKTTEIICRKNRHGPVFTIRFDFDESNKTFSEVEQ
jgi:replicative DNA helicase